MALELTPLINGREYGWADIVVNIGGVPITGITAIEYEEEMEKENIYGAGRYPVSRGSGRVKASAKISLLTATVLALKSKADKGQLHRLAPFSISVTYQPDGGALVKHILKNVEFKKTSFNWKEGDMSKSLDFDLIISHIEDKSV